MNYDTEITKKCEHFRNGHCCTSDCPNIAEDMGLERISCSDCVYADKRCDCDDCYFYDSEECRDWCEGIKGD